MSPVNTGGIQHPEDSDSDAIRLWLEALAGGKCDAPAFLQAIRDRFKSDPEANWEVLSQLDQYFRRGRIPTETFRVVKTALAESALRIVNLAPPPQMDVPPTQAAPPIFAAPAEPSRTIPVAVDVVAPPRTEHTDVHTRRESTPSSDTSVEPRPGSILRRRYRLETQLGQGSSGQVYQAVDEFRLDSPGNQRVAIKVLHPAVVKRADLFAELRREFQTLQLLSHPNIVRVHEFDRDGSTVFFTMELLAGATLSRVLQARKLAPLPEIQALAVVREIGSGLACGHSQNFAHSDLNPRNIFVTGPGNLRLLGFPGMPFATSGFSSCQVLEGERPDARDDVFSLACIAYLLLSGEHPFKEKTALEARAARMRIRRPAQISHRQWLTICAGLRWDREGRPADIRQWLLQLDAGIAGKRLSSLSDLLEAPPQKKRMSLSAALAAAGVVLVLAAAYWFISQRGVLPRLNPATSSRATAPPEAALAEAAPTTPQAAREVAPPAITPPVAKPKATSPLPAAPTPAPATQAPVAQGPAAQGAVSTPPVAQAPTAAAPVSTALAAQGAPAAASPHSSKVELAADTVDVPLGEPVALVSVHRRGSLRGETTFTWWTESGTAKTGTDFSAVAPQIAHIPDGKSSIVLSVPLSNAPHAQAKSFYVVIDETEGGAALAGRTLTMVTLQPAAD